MSNFKTESIASELADELARRTGLPATWGYVAGVPTVRLGEVTLKTAGGVAIQIQDQRGETDKGWDALPGFGGYQQPVYTTGVAKIVNESTVNTAAAVAFAKGTLTIGNGADTAFDALGTVTINGVVLTEGTDFAAGANDGTSATAIAAAVNAHPQLKNLVVAVATVGGAGVNSTVVLTAKIAGAGGNAITTVSSDVQAPFGAATLTGGAGASTTMYTSFATFMKVWAAIAKRGLKMELWQTAVGTAPMADFSTMNTSYLQAEFFPNEFWPLSGLV